MALFQAMAGHVPAIRVSASVLASALALVAGLLPAAAQMDQATRGRMQYLHRSLVLAEQNLGLAARDKDILRAKLVNDLLFNLSSYAVERKLAGNSCLEALGGLAGATVAVTFAIHPVIKGDPGAMTREELRFSEQMRPDDETMKTLFGENSATYRTKISDCERDIGAGKSARSLPDTLPQK
jgi:hypothetical protein